MVRSHLQALRPQGPLQLSLLLLLLLLLQLCSRHASSPCWARWWMPPRCNTRTVTLKEHGVNGTV
jgi:hypothetical protein